jgi:hypothetical protein
MSEAGGTESRDFWLHGDNQWRWTTWSTDKEAMDRGQVVRYLRAPDKFRSQQVAEEGVVSHGPRAEGAQEVLSASSTETKTSEAVVFTGFQIEPAQASVEAPVDTNRQGDRSETPTGGIANQMRISPFRCALCDRRFSINGKKRWQWTRCGGGVWHPGIHRYYYCRAWLCRFDDECLNAGKPCPCCKKIKRLQISDQSKSRGSSSSYNPAVHIEAVSDSREDGCVAEWRDDQGVCHSLHDV